jgi:hypothetical protein
MERGREPLVEHSGYSLRQRWLRLSVSYLWSIFCSVPFYFDQLNILLRCNGIEKSIIQNISHLGDDAGHAVGEGGIQIPVGLPKIEIQIGARDPIVVGYRAGRSVGAEFLVLDRSNAHPGAKRRDVEFQRSRSRDTYPYR